MSAEIVALAAQATRRLPEPSVLHTSGYTRSALTSGGRLDEGIQLLSKPYQRAQLAQKIREVLVGGRGTVASRPAN